MESVGKKQQRIKIRMFTFNWKHLASSLKLAIALLCPSLQKTIFVRPFVIRVNSCILCEGENAQFKFKGWLGIDFFHRYFHWNAHFNFSCLNLSMQSKIVWQCLFTMYIGSLLCECIILFILLCCLRWSAKSQNRQSLFRIHPASLYITMEFY